MEAIFQSSPCELCMRPNPIFEGDLVFYERFKVPHPKLCFHCRLQRRLAFYNRRKLYRRTCDLSGKPIISMFSPDKPFKVYEKDLWYSDAWNPMDYGREFDFKRPFFEQFYELMLSVPLLSLAVFGKNENSDFTNDNQRLRDCYLAFDCADGQEVLYAETFETVKDSMELLCIKRSELCYECINCEHCYNLKYSSFCKACTDAWFLQDCISCRSCFGCINLHQKEYYLFNEPVGREAYQKFLASFDSTSYNQVQAMRKRVADFYSTQPVRATRGVQNIDCYSDCVNSSKKAFMSFHSSALEDSRYCTDMLMGAKDSMDVHVWGDRAECIYNCCIVGEQVFDVFCSCFVGVGASSVAYSMFCMHNSSNLLGCIGLQRKNHCIFNKQYSVDDYQKLRLKIEAHMRETDEWGQFFPPQFSAFGYNESIAYPYFPITKEEVLKRGWKWSDYEAPVPAVKSITSDQLPDSSKEFTDEMLEHAILCEVTGKPFKVVSRELKFYRDQHLPIPRRHYDQRHFDRLGQRNPLILFQGQCGDCKNLTVTSYAPETTRTVLCETCYQKRIF